MRFVNYCLAVITGILCLSAWPLSAAPPTPQSSTTRPQIQFPDLKASIRLSASQYVDNGKVCYNVIPSWTITNQGPGKAPASEALLEWKTGGGANNWEVHSMSSTGALNPGGSTSMTGGATHRLRWCEGDANPVGFRITADHKGQVKETDERNNRAAAMYPR